MSKSREDGQLEPVNEEARQLLEAGRHDEAIKVADRAIASLLQPWLSVEDFIALSVRGAAAESLMRIEPNMIARVPSLHQPITVRWEALRRAGRMAEARLMRELCIRHFPQRASVWASAGNQALDEGDLKRAEHYFERCLKLSPDWTAGLAGKAIVLEERKDFAGALPYRARVVEVERALERDDAPSLQRVVRYALALARVGRWPEAGPLFGRAARLGAFASLPAERPVLLRMFSRELFAPAVLADMASQAQIEPAQRTPELRFALEQAAVLTRLYQAFEADPQLELETRLTMLGTCAWLCGDAARAYALFDEAEVHAQHDSCTQHLLACAAQALAHPELPTIVRFANEAALATLARAGDGAGADDEQLLYALLTLERFGAPSDARGALEVLSAARGAFVALYRDGLAQASVPAPTLQVDSSLDAPASLRRIGAFYATQLALGRFALEAAHSSHEALRALADLLTARAT